MAALKLQYPEGGEIIVPTLTWISDIASVLQCGFEPVFVDIDPSSLGMDTNQIIQNISDRTRAVFITHVQGFNGLTDELIDELKQRDIPLIEDVCESHGATHNGKKLGSIGSVSNFSFYYAHHMSTIEGGMICTNDEKLYQIFRMLRSHGMVREANNPDLQEEFRTNNAELNPDFIFAYPAYNVRNNELGAILGLSQLMRLDENVNIRSANQALFFELIDSSKYRTDFKFEGSSNYAFNLVLKEPDFGFVERLMDGMRSAGVEFRRGSAGGGNQVRQPYLRDVVPENHYKEFPEVEHIHFFGFYIGNFPDLSKEEIGEICGILNSID
jgi:CDP-6-deoxy-D-xylo-4-hexulose-3-dehydrase